MIYNNWSSTHVTNPYPDLEIFLMVNMKTFREQIFCEPEGFQFRWLRSPIG